MRIGEIMESNSPSPSRRDFLRHSVTGTALSAASISFLLSGEETVRANQVSSNNNPSERNTKMSKLQGTQTEKNLLKAFAGESQARNRYTYFGDKASEEGYEHIAAIFRETAEQEKIHALQFFQYLDLGGPLEITAMYPAGTILTTEKNLEASAAGELEEYSIIYPEFAKIAKEEGFADVARTFNAVAVAEKQHEKRYRGFLSHLQAGDVFKRDGVVWRCRNCGFVSSAPEAPGVCPACKVTQAWFEILAENW
ncbi:MAG: rubrerythrin [Thermoguttaceae bacterium]